MENAGRGASQLVEKLAPSGPVAILCGKGNNAGDGYVIARHLQLAGRPVRIFQLYAPESLTGDALANWRIIHHAGLPTRVLENPTRTQLEEELADFPVRLDCMLGTGATGNPRSPIAEAIEAANQGDAVRVAIDLPSGLDCDSGDVGTPCFQADFTLTFVAAKPGFTLAAARPYVGEVHTVGIGVPQKLLDEAFTSSQGPAASG